MLTTLCSGLTVRIVALDGVIRGEIRTSEALLAAIEDLTWKLLSFRIKVEGFFAYLYLGVVLMV